MLAAGFLGLALGREKWNVRGFSSSPNSCEKLAANGQMFMTVCSTRKTTANWHKHGVICWPVTLMN